MSKPDLIAMALDAMVAINAAIRNIRLYPAGSAMVKTSIERVLPPLNAVLEQKGSLSFAESEKSLLVFNEPLGEKELKKPQAASFLELLLDFGIRDISFQNGVTAAELEALFSLLSQKPEDIAAQGGLHQLCQGKALQHILLDHKVYVALAKDQVVTSAALSEDHGRAEAVGPGAASSDLKHDAAPVQMAAAVRGGIARLTTLGDGASGRGQAKALAQLLNVLDSGADPEETAALGKEVAASLAAMAPETLARVLAGGLPGAQAGGVLSQLAESLDDDAFTAVAVRLQVAAKGAGGGDGLSAHEALIGSERGQRLQERIDGAALEYKQAQGSRLKSGIERILGGDISPVTDPDLAQSAPRTVIQLMGQGKQRIATALIDRLQQGLRSEDAAIRVAAAAILAETGARLTASGNEEAMPGVSAALAQWLKAEATAMPALEDVTRKLQQLVQMLLKQAAYRRANRFIEPIGRIARGDIPKDPSVQVICDTTLKAIADKQTLDPVLSACWLKEGAYDPEALKSLQLLCPYSAANLLDRLADTEDRSERIHILRLYPELGGFGVSDLAARITSGGPWEYLRDLVSLMGKMGAAAHIDILEPLLLHEELRVQREVLNTIHAIGGDRRGKVLARYLPSADDQMKAPVASLLGALKYAPAAAPLMALLDSKAAISPKHKDQVQIKGCQALGAIGAAEAVPLLTTIAKQKGLILKAYSAEVQEAAQKALTAIEKAPPKAAAPAPGASPKPPAAAPKTAPADDDRERAVDAFVAAGDTEAAVKLLFELIVEQAKRRNFVRAEALRDKMMSVDEMALNEIIKAAEVIEEEKSAALDGGIAELWESIYTLLSPEEANALFYAMETVAFPVDKVILEQHQINDRLFFINQGSVKSVYREDGDKETLLKTYKKGEVFGVDTFFDIKVCSTSLVAATPVTAMVLPRSALAVWKESQPGLEPKLVNHFLTQVKEHALLMETGLTQRRFKRFKVGGKLLIQIIDAGSTPVGKPFKGDLSDLSAGGLSFLIKTSKSETARMLLGRRLRMAITVAAKDAPFKITQTGTVLGVDYLLQTDYSVQVRFAEPLKASEKTALEGLASAEPM